MKKLCILFVLIVSNTLNAEVDQRELFKSASGAFADGDFDTAIQIYSEIEQNGFSSFSLQMNLASAYYRNSDRVLALVHFERALLENKSSKEARENIEIIRDELGVDIVEIDTFFLNKILYNIAYYIPKLLWIFLEISLMLAFMYFLYNYKTQSDKKLKINCLKSMTLIGVVLMAVLLVGYFSERAAEQNQYFILTETLELFTAADPRSDLLRELPSGVKFRIVDSIDDWIKIELINKEMGWLNSKSMIRI